MLLDQGTEEQGEINNLEHNHTLEMQTYFESQTHLLWYRLPQANSHVQF